MTESLKNISSTFIAICIVTILPHTGIIPLPFGYVIPIFLFIWFYLKSKNVKFSSIGLVFKPFSIKPLAHGALAAILTFGFINYIFFPLLKCIIEFPPTEVEFYKQIKGNTPFYLFLLIMGWLVGGFYEEIVFHGFIFTQLEKILPQKKTLFTSFLLTNLIFSLYHFQLGYEGGINAFLAGSIYHALTLWYNRNLWYGIFCHAIFDSIALTQLYFGYQ